MDLVKAENIMALMRRYGCEHIKTLEFEFKLASQQYKEVVCPETVPKGVQNSAPSQIPEPQAIPPKEMKIPHKLNEVVSLLKLSDHDLVDKMFPDYSQSPPKREDS